MDKLVENTLEFAKRKVNEQIIEKGLEMAKEYILENYLKKRTNENNIGRVVVVGLAGQGKSNLINLIVGKPVAKSEGIDGGGSGVTKDITEYNTTLQNDINIKLYDTPGIGDLDIKLEELKNQFEKNFNNKRITSFLYVKRIDDNRVMNEEFASIKICEACFSGGDRNALENLIVVFTYSDKLDNDKKDTADQIASEILNLYNAKVEKGNKIYKYVIIDKAKPEDGINKLIDLLKKIENKFLVQNNFLFEMSKKILIEYNFDPNCFNWNTTINRKNHYGIVEKVCIKDIMIGDLVETNFCHFEPVLTVSHHSKSLYILKNLTISFEGNLLTLQVTDNHMLLITRKGNEIYIPTREVELSDQIEVRSLEKNVGSIIDIKQLISKNVVNIRTASRKLVTNDIISTCDIEEDLGDFGGMVLSTAGKINKYLPQKINQLAIKLYSKFRKLSNKEKIY